MTEIDNKVLEASAIKPEEHEASATLLQCVHSTSPARDIYGPFNVNTVYEPGKAGDDWMSYREVDTNNGRIDYQAKIDGKTYFDIIGLSDEGNPGQDTIIEYKPELRSVKNGSPEFNNVVNFIHDLYDTGLCGAQYPKK